MTKEALSGCQCPECQVVLHASDCAVHNGPAYSKGKCDCGVQQEPEFFTHSVDQPYDWSEWVCPDPKSYLMKCCDCGLVHEAEFGVVGGMALNQQRTWVGLTDAEIADEFYKFEAAGAWYQFAHAIEAKLKEKNT